MIGRFEFAAGLLIWAAVLWDGFATIVLPRTVAPTRRLSGKFNHWIWWFWAAVGRRIRTPDLRLNFLAIFGPISVMLLLIVWAGLMIVAFALVYHGSQVQFQATTGPTSFSTLLYMSGSTFLTLGLGDVVSADPTGRFFMVLEAASGLIFLGLVITYMPLLDQAYASREVYNMLLHSRAGRSPVAIQLLHRYTGTVFSGTAHSEILRSNLREGERWMAETLQSHLSHPVLSFYRAQRWGQSWLISLTMILDTCALLIAAGEGLPAVQARLTYRMGMRLVKDLTAALGIHVDQQCRMRLDEADLPELISAIEAAGLNLSMTPVATRELLRLARLYDVYLAALSSFLLIPLPGWIPQPDTDDKPAGDEPGAWDE